MVQCLLQLRIQYAYIKPRQTRSTKVLKSDWLGLLFYLWTTRHCSVKKHPFIYAQSLAHAFIVLCWKQMANVSIMFQHATTPLRYIKITQRLLMFLEIPMWVNKSWIDGWKRMRSESRSWAWGDMYYTFYKDMSMQNAYSYFGVSDVPVFSRVKINTISNVWCFNFGLHSNGIDRHKTLCMFTFKSRQLWVVIEFRTVWFGGNWKWYIGDWNQMY